MPSDGATPHRNLLAIALTASTLVAACAIPGVMKYEDGIWITLRDSVSREDARVAMNVVVDHFPDRDFTGYAISVGKWHTPGIPTELDLRCRYAVNIDLRAGFAGESYCVGTNEDSGGLEVLTGLDWIT